MFFVVCFVCAPSTDHDRDRSDPVARPERDNWI
jgi:hypothetical protein